MIRKFINEKNKTAFVYDDREISYRELLASIGQYSNSFSLAKGDRVLLFSENRPEWIYAFYASWGKGGINVPIDASIETENLRYIIDDCTPSIIFCSQGTFERAREAVSLAGTKPKILEFHSLNGTADAVFASAEIHPDDIAVIVYTSGTTGNPKGVMLSFQNLISNIEALIEFEMFMPDDKILGLLPFHHILPLQGIVIAPFYIGASVVYVKNLAPEAILEACQKHGVTMFLGVPRLYELFHAGIIKKLKAHFIGRFLLFIARKIGNQKFGRILFGAIHRRFGGKVHSFLTGGAKMDPEIARDLWALGFRLVEGYGLTETSPLVAFNPFDNIRLGSVGIPLKGSDVEIHDGEIVVRGPNVMKGYYNKPEETAHALRDGWFHTGDTGYFDDDGYLFITGRKDEMIVLPNGKNINPEEIENRILRISPLVKEIGVMHNQGRLTALILPDFSLFEGADIHNAIETLKEKVIEKYNSTVAGYKKILNFSLIREELPKTRLGKLKRFLFKDLASTVEGQSFMPEEPDFPEYSLIKNHIAEYKAKEVYAHYHLEIDCGLDSLDMVELMSFIDATFGLVLSRDDISPDMTVETLAKLVREKKTRMDAATIDWKKILYSDNEHFSIENKSRLSIPLALFKPIFMRYFSISTNGLENIPPVPCVIAPNHASYLDAPCVGFTLPKDVFQKTYYIAKPKFLTTLLMAIFAGKKQVIKVDAEKNLKESLQKAAAVLRAGGNVLIYPEGTRSRDGKIGAFKKSFAILAKELGTPIVPVVINGTFEAMPRGKFWPRRGKIHISYLPAVEPHGKSYDEIVEEAKKRIEGNREREK